MQYHFGKLEEKNNAIPCLGLSIILFLILGVLPILPTQFTQVLRPTEIALCFVFPAAFNYRLTTSSLFMLIFMAYYVFVLLSNPITMSAIMAWASLELFSAFFLFMILRPWSRKNIRMMLFVSAIASAVFSAIIFRDNPDFLHEKAYEGVFFMSTTVNDNTAAFSIVPGALCSVLLLFFYSPRKHSVLHWQKLLFLLCAGLSFFSLFCLGARSAFFSALAGVALIVLEWSNHRRRVSERFFARVGMSLLLITLFVVGTKISTGTHSARLFDLDNMTNGTGRELLAEQAWNMIHKKPIFGGGFDYWEKSNGDPLGTHNSFLTHMVQGGYIAAIILSCFLLTAVYELLKSKSLIPLAFAMEMIAHTFTESDLNYYAYVPLIISFVMVRCASFHNCRIKDLFVDS